MVANHMFSFFLLHFLGNLYNVVTTSPFISNENQRFSSFPRIPGFLRCTATLERCRSAVDGKFQNLRRKKKQENLWFYRGKLEITHMFFKVYYFSNKNLDLPGNMPFVYFFRFHARHDQVESSARKHLERFQKCWLNDINDERE